MSSYRLPLSGVRVLDLTTAWAGPYATRLIADMGAEVIKIESAGNWDVIRALHLLGGDTEQAHDRSALFNHLNRNKLGLALDLSKPGGRALFLRLVALSDAVVENYRVDVMESFGLSFEALKAARDDIILVSMPGHGRGGPESSYLLYGTHVEQMSGLVSMTGYADRGPQKTGVSYGDPVAGVFGAAALLLALHQRRQTGRGRWVEVAQRESFISLLGECYVGHAMNGRQPPRRGNRHPTMAPHGCYPCRSEAQEGAWLTLAVGSDQEFAALCGAMGRPELAADAQFGDVVSRHHNQDELDGIISAWTREREARETASLLQEAGVTASAVLSIPELMADDHLRSRGFFETVAHAVAGVWDMDGPVWRLSLTPAHVRFNGPCFGEHNDYVLRGLLGLSAEQVAALEREGVVGRVPDPATHA